jgi:hypothetical protein
MPDQSKNSLNQTGTLNLRDIRDQVALSDAQFKALNFINVQGPYAYRKFYRSGLRSHIFEVVNKTDLIKERQGVKTDGVLMFPRARPVKMFRILRQRFTSIDQIFKEIKKYTTLLDALGADYIARSDEIIVDYRIQGKYEILLCGLQEYVEGEILDPWRVLGENYLYHLYHAVNRDHQKSTALAESAKKSIQTFVKKIRQMIDHTGFLPDLAGIGNLILTPEAGLKLVDINNIVKIKLDDSISIDDKGYPSCDVSIQVLAILEKDLLEQPVDLNDPLYNLFLAPGRKKKVKQLERQFYRHLEQKKEGLNGL